MILVSDGSRTERGSRREEAPPQIPLVVRLEKL